MPNCTELFGNGVVDAISGDSRRLRCKQRDVEWESAQLRAKFPERTRGAVIGDLRP